MSGIIVTLEDQLRCAKREFELRKRHYPRWVNDGKMRQHVAETELAAQQAIVYTIEALVRAKRGTTPLSPLGDFIRDLETQL